MTRRRSLPALALASVLLAGCTWPFGQLGGTPASSSSAGQAAIWTEPAAYRYTFTSTCGERMLVGTFEVTVEDGSVTGFRAQDPPADAFPGTAADLPTLGDIQRKAQEAAADDEAIVELERDLEDGHPTLVEIDWLPNAIDDEECYSITSYTPDA
jgi:hypothetical protein